MVYAARSRVHGELPGLCRTEFLHHLLLPKKPGFLVDHINLDSLDDQRGNLRYVTRTGNSANRSKQRGKTTSQYKGVSWLKCGQAWMAYIKHHGKRSYLGLFNDEEDAARAYDVAAVRLFGEFARPNFL
jgi:hypothetical protein